MVKPPLLNEPEFLRLTKNHGSFCNTLRQLGHETTSSGVTESAYHVGLCWLRLALEHMGEAKAAAASKFSRSAYSRAYYAAYNASKSVRYIVNGLVSLNADDHKKAGPDLPDDFPDVEKWAATIPTLYEHRLRADYDNWSITESQHSLSVLEVVDLADQFVSEAARYLERKCGITA